MIETTLNLSIDEEVGIFILGEVGGVNRKGKTNRIF